jgi:predicted PurR-regulated permease PerM
MSYLTITKKWPKGISAIMLMIISMILFLFPMNALIQILGKQFLPYLQNSQNIYIYVQKFIHDLEVRYGVEIMTQDNIGSVSDWLVQEGRMILSATLNSLGLVVILYFILYFLLTNGKNMEHKLLSFLPLNDTNTKYFRKNLQSLVLAMPSGFPLFPYFRV